MHDGKFGLNTENLLERFLRPFENFTLEPLGVNFQKHTTPLEL